MRIKLNHCYLFRRSRPISVCADDHTNTRSRSLPRRWFWCLSTTHPNLGVVTNGECEGPRCSKRLLSHFVSRFKGVFHPQQASSSPPRVIRTTRLSLNPAFIRSLQDEPTRTCHTGETRGAEQGAGSAWARRRALPLHSGLIGWRINFQGNPKICCPKAANRLLQ